MEIMLNIAPDASKKAVYQGFQRLNVTKVLKVVKFMIIFEIDVDFWKQE